MASVENRGASGWRVVWREAGEKQYERFATEAEALLFLGYMGGENRWPHGWVKGHGYGEAESMCPTFHQWAERAIDARSKANRRTRADYRRDLTNHIYPVFGDLHLDRIDAMTVGRWLILLTEPKPGTRALAAKTVKNIHALASSVYEDAMQSGKAPGPNPFAKAMRSLPAVRTEEIVPLTKLEVDRIAAALAEAYRPLVILLAHTGLRWSEATALKVGDVDLFGQRKTVAVTKAWKRDEGSTYYIGEPKSRRSRRTLALDGATVEALIPLVASRSASDWLFTTATGRVVQHSAFYKSHWRPTIERLNRCEQHPGPDLCGCPGTLAKRPRIHDMRHAQASWLISAGLDAKVVQSRMGHESIQTTYDRYGHLFSDSDDKVVAALDGMSAPAASLEPERILDR